MEGEPADVPMPVPTTAGAKLRAAREAQKLDLAEVASRTRIPQRHLEAIEDGSYSGLPSTTYAIGFARAYARAVGADEVAIAAQVRSELGQYERVTPTPDYPLDDPSRVAPRGLAWAGVVIAVLLLIGAGIWYGSTMFHENGTPAASTQGGDGLVAMPANGSAPATPPASAPPLPAVEHVTLTALDTVWLRVTDDAGKRVFEKELAKGEKYDVPVDLQHPHVRTGRPGNIQVTINGSQVPPLGQGVETVNVDVSAAALRARGQPAATPSPAATATPAASQGQRRLGERAPTSIDYSAPAAVSPPANSTQP